MDTDRTLSARELATRYGVKLQKIHRWIETGELIGLNVGNGSRLPRWRVTINSVAEFERRRSSKPRPDLATTRRKADETVIEFFA